MDIFLQDHSLFLLIITIVWVLPWKAYALWTAARRADKKWFIIILILNTLAILEIFYLFYIVKKTPKDLARLIKRHL